MHERSSFLGAHVRLVGMGKQAIGGWARLGGYGVGGHGQGRWLALCVMCFWGFAERRCLSMSACVWDCVWACVGVRLCVRVCVCVDLYMAGRKVIEECRVIP